MADFVTTIILAQRRLLLTIVGLLAIAAIIPAARVGFDNSIEIWFLDDDPGLAIYNRFSEQFQADQIAVIGIFDDDMFDEGTLSLIDRITTAAAALDHVFRVNSITNSTLASRLDDGFNDPAFRKTIMASPAMNGTLITPDSSAAAIVIYYSRAGEAIELKNKFVAALEEIVESETGEMSATFALTGAPVMGKAGQVKNQQDMRTLVPIMILIILLVTFSLFRDIWLSLLPLAVVAVAAVWSFAFMNMVGWHMTMLSAMLMPLILTVGVADTIHIVAHFRRQIAKGNDRLQAVRISLAELLKPCFLTTITTMIGLLALLVSAIAPVRQFGVVAAVGVLAAFLVSITLVPALLVMIPPTGRTVQVRTDGHFDCVLRWASRLSGNRPRMIIWSSLVLVIAGAWLASRVTVGLDPLTWFPAADPYRMAAEKVDKSFGGSLSMEFLVSAPPDSIKQPMVLRRLEKFETWLVANTEITRTFSVAGMVKEAARVARNEGAAGYTLPRTRIVIDGLLDSMRRSGDLDGWVQPDYSSARISARIPVTGTRKIVQQTPSIREYLQAEFANGDLQVQMTGHAVLVGQMQDYVIRSQIASFTVALVAISVLMFLLLRSLLLGLLAMIPNLIPLIAGLAAMTIFGFDLNPGTVMITAVALGIVVDDTVHFMTGIGRALHNTSDIASVIERVIREVGRPLVVTSILLTLGFSVMLFGSFLPSRQVGGVSALIIVVALLADIILLPAILRLVARTFLHARLD